MEAMIQLFVTTGLKFFFLTTPFFALSMFLAMTPKLAEEERDRLANRVIFAAWLEGRLGQKGLSILMRLTGLILSALSAQMIMTGIVSFLASARAS